MRPPCWVCDEPFSDFEWERHHDGAVTDGQPCHEDCCPEPDCVHARQGATP